MAAPQTIPDFDDLPKVEGMPQGCAWGIFDKDGEKDVYGTLNLLTPDVVAAAATEVKEGISVSLNWPLNGFPFPIPGRKAPVHTVTPLKDVGYGADGWDDELAFNTQLSSQWDSLCHFHHQDSGLAYNGARPTRASLTDPAAAAAAEHQSVLPTIDKWHARGGLVGRGVLLDFARYADEVLSQQDGTKQTSYHPADGYRITVADLEAVAAWQGVEFRRGDIVVIRTAYTEVMAAPTPDDFARMQKVRLSGVHGTEETARWFWDRRFAAVAGDSASFEAFPPLRPDGSEGEMSDLVLHKYFLAMFGMPIGELWDLKALSEQCKRLGRYSFMLTSVPLNHHGLVASPPNALAIF
ncbi:uncharacterized protein E0L32_006726 [Thyridium curvatum]|uniref:Cyclase n=1 Tax=Thyridium curvatum TaxID=1093900 RepID=A0A507B1C9_9PEZI|nr:uncharacterized protein E0L32_006726 [Thyridium curvatum]TPX12846.1 hypothetical protein E0L32_006726 [Thyridium curvatum]